jgi:hypothetical protein
LALGGKAIAGDPIGEAALLFRQSQQRQSFLNGTAFMVGLRIGGRTPNHAGNAAIAQGHADEIAGSKLLAFIHQIVEGARQRQRQKHRDPIAGSIVDHTEA